MDKAEKIQYFEEELDRLHKMKEQKEKQLLGPDSCTDILHKAAWDDSQRHNRRASHNALTFWHSPGEEHPMALLQDKKVEQTDAVKKDRADSRIYDIRFSGGQTLADMT